ncbi:glycoside hydrolase family 76 protein [Hypoxylon sp. FL1857]|nr:glycoside hydrolase family 76 protein [Hypoxylon sp. FL1857]
MARVMSNPLARVLLVAHGALAGLTVDVEDTDSVRAAAALVAEDLMAFYPGNKPGNIPGIFAEPSDGDYYWWTGGALWNTMLNYRNHTGETKYDEVISQGLVWQIGPNADYLSPNWTATEGNDDQGIWALSAIAAEEFQFQEPGQDNTSWLTIARNVFDEQQNEDRRVDDGACEGALRWQIYMFNQGYDYVNSASNAEYFNLAAQLARLTGNKTYEDAAGDTFELLENIGLVNKEYDVYDGTHVSNCGDINKAQFSSNAALLLQGAAYMYNHTGGDDDWKERVDGLVSRTLEVFFPNGVAFEIACEKQGACNSDMYFYKSILHRGLGSTMELAPYTTAKILPVLKSSAKSAAAQCTGGDNGRLCGFHWSTGKFDGKTGPAQQMGVLEALVSLLPAQSAAAGNSSSSTTTGSGSGSNSGSGSGTAQGSTSSNVPDGNMGARAGVSLGAVMGALLGSLLI